MNGHRRTPEFRFSPLEQGQTQISTFTRDDLKTILNTRFGLDDFRPLQAEAIEVLLKGGNAFVTMATSGGKSLIYQLPALLLPGVTIVISPLIELSNDQVAQLRKMRIAAACYHSNMSALEKAATLRGLKLGQLKLIYLSPESLHTRDILEAVQTCGVSLLAVDEAHCISKWGHNFRLDYLKIADFHRAVGRVPVLGVTATAPVDVLEDCLKQLDIPDAVIFTGDLDRPNITWGAQSFSSDAAKIDYLTAQLRKHDKRGESVIVYAHRTRTVDALTAELNLRGIDAKRYHAQMVDLAERKEAARSFMADETRVLVASPAFGLGINKPNIRAVYHFEIPNELETYIQEAGRAGRNGAPAICTVLVTPYDIAAAWNRVVMNIPRAAKLREITERLLKWFPDGETIPIPNARRFPTDSFLGRETGDTRKESLMRGIFGALTEAGLFAFGYNLLTLLRRPSEFTGSAFPFDDEEQLRKRKTARDQVAVMAYYALSPGGHRELQREHLTHHRVIETVDPQNIDTFKRSNRHALKEILRELEEREFQPTFLALHLAGTRIGKRTNGKKAAKRFVRPGAKRLKEFTFEELRLEIDLAVADGHIHKTIIAGSAYLTLTKSGVALARELGIPAFVPKDAPSLGRRLRHPDTHSELRRALGPWFNEWRSSLLDPETRDSAIGELFSSAFTVCGIEISGRRLALPFGRERKINQVRASSALALFRWVFPEAFETTSS